MPKKSTLATLGETPVGDQAYELPLLGHELQLQYGYQRYPYMPMHDFRATLRRQF